MIVTIDGGAGTGKSTAAKLLAAYYGISVLNTGALYRTVALYAEWENLDVQDERAMAQIARRISPPQIQGKIVHVAKTDVSDVIWSLKISQDASKVSKHPAVRVALLEPQRAMAKDMGSCIAEGRDTGTVVFPQTDHKFFFTAPAEERARRRMKDMPGSSFEDILKDIEARDRRERSRSMAPMIPAQDATLLDTGDKTVGEILDFMLETIEAKSRPDEI